MLRPGLSPLGLALAFVALGWLCATAGLWTPIEWAAEAAHLPAASGLPVGLPLGLALSWVVVSRWRALPGVPLGVLGLHLLMRGGATRPLIGQEVLFVTALAASTATGLVAVAAAALKSLHLDRSPLADLRSAGTLLGLLTALAALQAAASILGLGWLEPWTEPERYDGAWHAFAGTFSGLMVVLPGVLIARSDTVTGHRAHWVAATSLAVVLLGRALSANHHGSDAALAQSEFIAHSESAARALGRELEVTETLLRGLAGHIDATPEVHAEGFGTMSQQLQLQANAVHAVSWNPVVSQAQRTAFERADTHGPAQPLRILDARLVGPPGAGGRAAERPRYVVVQLIEPLASNRMALGFDIASDPVRRKALESAELSGQITATARIRLVQESGQSWGLLVLLAVDGPPAAGDKRVAAPSTRGFATLVLRIEDLARGALAAHPAGGPLAGLDPAPIRYRLVDATAPIDQGLLFDSAARPAPPADPVGRAAGPWMARPAMHHLVELPFASRGLRLQAESTPAFWAERSEEQIRALDLGLAALQTLGVLLTLLVTGQRQHLRTTLDARTLALQQAESRLRHQSEQLRAVVAASREGFATFDQHLRLCSHNERMALACGLDDPVLATLDARRLLNRLIARHHGGAGPVPPALLGPIRAGLEGELTLDLGEQERRRHVLVSVQPLNAPGLSVVVLLHDVTEFAQLSRAKSQFLATAAHEIRTPMTLVHGYAHLLSASPDLPPAQRTRLVGKMLTATESINRLVSGLVHCAHLDTPGAVVLHPQALSLGPWLAQACGHVEPPGGPPAPRLAEGPAQARAWADPDALQQVLSELLHNAHGFSPAGAPVTVSWRAQDSDGPAGTVGGWVIEVRDEGAGIDPAHLPQVFDRFFRADTSGTRPGFGLGLAIARATARCMGGEVDLQSTPGQGTLARVHLPAATTD